GDVEDPRVGSMTESTQTRSYPRRITDGSLAGRHNPDPDASQNTASRGLVSPHFGPLSDKSAHLVNAPRAGAAGALPDLAFRPAAPVAFGPPPPASGAPSDCPTIGGVPRGLRPAGGTPQRLAWALPRPWPSPAWRGGLGGRWRPVGERPWPAGCASSPRAPA